ncbi:MAG: hypothetical protein J0M12_06280 [Deltaproteobacteria bacterium]|nr:hypothetical protein [Deltaproteobacteria bacterium]
MGSAAEEIRITLTLSVDEVHWPQVLDVLGKRQRLPFLQVSDILKDFFGRLLKPFNLYWFSRRTLSINDNRLLAAVCECHGADTVILTVEKPFRAGPLRLSYHQEIEFQPNLRSSDTTRSGRSSAQIVLSMFGRALRVNSIVQVLSIYALLCIIGVLAYVVLVGAFMYALAVFLLFLEQPLGVTEAATSDVTIGLALLCFLVASAALFGRAVSNLGKLALSKLRVARDRR